MQIFFKHILPPFILKALRFIYFKLTQRPITNYFNTDFNRNVLISYIVNPFRIGVDANHTNTAEARTIASVFNELGYNVDIVHYNETKEMDFSKYDVFFGFGEPVEKSFARRKKDAAIIYYGTGMYVQHQNMASLKRIREAYQKKGVWLIESARVVEKTWSVQTSLADGIIVLGNDTVLESYKEINPNPIYNIPVSYYKFFDQATILQAKDLSKAKNHFLWFGGAGLIHKGLDLLLEVFKEIGKVHLHICGPIDKEDGFKKCYFRELYHTPNIHTYGWVSPDSVLFKDLMSKCAFVIFPSCSEGEPSSVINTMVYGLIPIVTATAGIRTKNFGIGVADLTYENIKESVEYATSLDTDSIKQRSLDCSADTIRTHSLEKFCDELRSSLLKILK